MVKRNLCLKQFTNLSFRLRQPLLFVAGIKSSFFPSQLLPRSFHVTSALIASIYDRKKEKLFVCVARQRVVDALEGLRKFEISDFGLRVQFSKLFAYVVCLRLCNDVNALGLRPLLSNSPAQSHFLSMSFFRTYHAVMHQRK